MRLLTIFAVFAGKAGWTRTFIIPMFIRTFPPVHTRISLAFVYIYRRKKISNNDSIIIGKCN